MLHPLVVCGSTPVSKNLFSLVLLLYCPKYKIRLLLLICENVQKTSTTLTLEFIPFREEGYTMPPLKIVQVASWQMHPDSARATSRTCSRPWSERGWTCSTVSL